MSTVSQMLKNGLGCHENKVAFDSKAVHVYVQGCVFFIWQTPYSKRVPNGVEIHSINVLTNVFIGVFFVSASATSDSATIVFLSKSKQFRTFRKIFQN